MNTQRQIFALPMPQTGSLSGSLEGESNRSPAAGSASAPGSVHAQRNEDGL
jgi:hypothetical protein